MSDHSRDENDAVRDKRNKVQSVPLLFGGHEAAEEIAKNLIKEHHCHLATARMKYICRNKSTKRAGIPVPGNVYKMSNKFEYLVGCDFVVEVALDVWNEYNPQQRIALIDHLLTRCTCTEDEESGDLKWHIRPPEIQEFSEVAERNGTWNLGLAEFGRCLAAK
jgi:hypothetical protein